MNLWSWPRLYWRTTRANCVPLEVRVSTYVSDCLSLATRHAEWDETTNRPKWHRPRAQAIMPPLRILPTRPSPLFPPRSSLLPASFEPHPAILLDYQILSNYANAPRHAETRILDAIRSFAEWIVSLRTHVPEPRFFVYRSFVSWKSSCSAKLLQIVHCKW